jgi:hypothetical protein
MSDGLAWKEPVERSAAQQLRLQAPAGHVIAVIV